MSRALSQVERQSLEARLAARDEELELEARQLAQIRQELEQRQKLLDEREDAIDERELQFLDRTQALQERETNVAVPNATSLRERRAVLVGVGQFHCPRIPQLRHVYTDAEEFAVILSLLDYDVRCLVAAPSDPATREMAPAPPSALNLASVGSEPFPPPSLAGDDIPPPLRPWEKAEPFDGPNGTYLSPRHPAVLHPYSPDRMTIVPPGGLTVPHGHEPDPLTSQPAILPTADAIRASIRDAVDGATDTVVIHVQSYGGATVRRPARGAQRTDYFVCPYELDGFSDNVSATPTNCLSVDEFVQYTMLAHAKAADESARLHSVAASSAQRRASLRAERDTERARRGSFHNAAPPVAAAPRGSGLPSIGRSKRAPADASYLSNDAPLAPTHALGEAAPRSNVVLLIDAAPLPEAMTAGDTSLMGGMRGGFGLLALSDGRMLHVRYDGGQHGILSALVIHALVSGTANEPMYAPAKGRDPQSPTASDKQCGVSAGRLFDFVDRYVRSPASTMYILHRNVPPTAEGFLVASRLLTDPRTRYPSGTSAKAPPERTVALDAGMADHVVASIEVGVAAELDPDTRVDVVTGFIRRSVMPLLVEQTAKESDASNGFLDGTTVLRPMTAAAADEAASEMGVVFGNVRALLRATAVVSGRVDSGGMSAFAHHWDDAAAALSAGVSRRFLEDRQMRAAQAGEAESLARAETVRLALASVVPDATEFIAVGPSVPQRTDSKLAATAAQFLADGDLLAAPRPSRRAASPVHPVESEGSSDDNEDGEFVERRGDRRPRSAAPYGAHASPPSPPLEAHDLVRMLTAATADQTRVRAIKRAVDAVVDDRRGAIMLISGELASAEAAGDAFARALLPGLRERLDALCAEEASLAAEAEVATAKLHDISSRVDDIAKMQALIRAQTGARLRYVIVTSSPPRSSSEFCVVLSGEFVQLFRHARDYVLAERAIGAFPVVKYHRHVRLSVSMPRVAYQRLQLRLRSGHQPTAGVVVFGVRRDVANVHCFNDFLATEGREVRMVESRTDGGATVAQAQAAYPSDAQRTVRLFRPRPVVGVQGPSHSPSRVWGNTDAPRMILAVRTSTVPGTGDGSTTADVVRHASIRSMIAVATAPQLAERMSFWYWAVDQTTLAAPPVVPGLSSDTVSKLLSGLTPCVIADPSSGVVFGMLPSRQLFFNGFMGTSSLLMFAQRFLSGQLDRLLWEPPALSVESAITGPSSPQSLPPIRLDGIHGSVDPSTSKSKSRKRIPNSYSAYMIQQSREQYDHPLTTFPHESGGSVAASARNAARDAELAPYAILERPKRGTRG